VPDEFVIENSSSEELQDEFYIVGEINGVKFIGIK